MRTINDIAPTIGLQPDSLKKRLSRNGQKFGLNDPLPLEVVSDILGEHPPAPSIEKKPIQDKPKKLDRKKPDTQPDKKNIPWTKILASLPLPMLGLAASYGVFAFASFFTPAWVAIGEAAAFELTYIGLTALTGLSEQEQRRAALVAQGAVFVSVVYNTLAGIMHMAPGWFVQDGKIVLDTFWIWSMGVLHGAPLALLAYQVALLLVHRKK